MKDAITNISKDQTCQLQMLLALYHLDQYTASKAQKYYRELRKLNHQHTQHLNIDHLMKTSIVIAEQAHPLSTLQGLKAEPLCLALNQMISERSSVRAVAQGLNMYLIGSSKRIEHHLKEGLALVVEKITFGLNYINKFEKAIQYFDFVLVTQTSSVSTGVQYLQLFKSFSWLLFLVMHQKIAIRHLYEADYLLIAVLYLMARYVFDYLRPRSAQRVGTNKDIISNILNQLFQIFEIDHPLAFKVITAEVDDHFQKLIQHQTLKYHQAYDFLSPNLIKLNYKRIDNLYTSKQNPHCIDYRLLLQNRPSTLTPAKNHRQTHNLTHLAKQVDKRKSFASHKILTFDGQQIVDKSIQRSNQPCQIKLPQNVRVSPYYSRTPLICARKPSPNLISIQTYMINSIKNNFVRLQTLKNQQEVLETVKNVLGHNNSTVGLKDKVELTYRYYLVISNQYFNTREWDDADYNGIHCSCLAFSLLFSLLTDKQSNHFGQSIKEYIVIIRQQVAVSPFQLFLVCMHLKCYSQKPKLVEEIVQYIEQLIIDELVWQSDCCHQIVSHLRQRPSQVRSLRQQSIQILSKSIMLRMKGVIYALVSSFYLSDQTQITDDILAILKQLLIQGEQIFEGRHLHQLVLVSTYLVFREKNLNIKFNDIISHHQSANDLTTAHIKRIVTQVSLDSRDQRSYVDIIHFYNQAFLAHVKYIRSHIKNKPVAGPSPTNSYTAAIQERPSASDHSRNSTQDPRNQAQSCEAQGFIPAHQNMTEHPLNQKQANRTHQETAAQECRDETKIRARPGGCIIGQLQTDKFKSPSIVR